MSITSVPWMGDVPNDDVSHMTGLGLENNLSTLGEDSIFYYHRGFIVRQEVVQPILVLIHGYPQSNFMWRHIIPLLPSDVPLFIPDIPGYGRSKPLSTAHDKRAVSESILHTLVCLLPRFAEAPIILIGHDRGARICHRIAVDVSNHNFRIRFSPDINIIGTILLDIVPTLVQFQSFGNPSYSVGTFHWPFLANAELATDMIKAFGGDKWARMCIDRWAGRNEASLAKLRSDNAMGVYGEFFKKDSVIRASCDDYGAGANDNVNLQREDQVLGRKIDIDVLVLYSEGYLDERYAVEGVWEDWMGTGKLDAEGFGDGCGHYIAEEKPVEVATAILRFYEKFD